VFGQGNADGNLVTVLRGSAPSSIEELRAMQDRVRLLTERVLPATVGVEVGAAQGSGVIVTADGYVLTAAHVIGSSRRRATVFLHDGRRLPAETLGTCRSFDAGLLKIDAAAADAVKLVHVPVGNSSHLAVGQWCLATGHPGGVQPWHAGAVPPAVFASSRTPALRLGRILTLNTADPELPSLSSDCTLIGGDSGGPLFDMEGRVIGIHSRIAESLTANVHVPINVFRDSWVRLRDGENWGAFPGSQPFLGVQGVADAEDARIGRVFPDSPAEKAGMRSGDIVIRFAGHPIRDFASLQRYVEEQVPGAKTSIVVQRGSNRVELDIVVGRKRQ
jgi:serine protease Do